MSIVLQVRMPSVLHDRLKQIADTEGIGISELARRVLSGVLEGRVSTQAPIVPAYVEKVGGSKSKVCAVCGTATERWVYDMNKQVKCQGCAG